MLSAGRITREELYEAVWSEPVQKLALALGISDVGLAKICKKLNVPRPGRGYWAKPRGTRKLLRVPLPPLKTKQEESYVISSPETEGGAGWTRESLQHLAGEGLTVPTISASAPPKGGHPLISAYRELLVQHGLETSQLWPKQACLAVSVTPGQLERSLDIVQRIFEAFEKQGYQPEVLPPNPHGRNRYGYQQASPSRTGVRIKGIFVAFELKEVYTVVEVSQPPPDPPTGKRKNVWAPPPPPIYKKVTSGDLTLEIVEPERQGARKRWRDQGLRKLEKSLDAFLQAVMVTADREHEDELERERRKKEEEAVERRKQEEAARQAELASRMYDLESRIMDVQQAQAIRSFALAVRTDAEARGLSTEPATDLGAWLHWVDELAENLERSAVQTLSTRRRPPEPKPSYGFNQAEQNEALMRNEVDLWRRRYIYGRR
jgi:hypothetical protein